MGTQTTVPAGSMNSELERMWKETVVDCLGLWTVIRWRMEKATANVSRIAGVIADI